MNPRAPLKTRSGDGDHELVGPISVGQKDYVCICGGSVSTHYLGEIETRFVEHVRIRGGTMTTPPPEGEELVLLDEEATSD